MEIGRKIVNLSGARRPQNCKQVISLGVKDHNSCKMCKTKNFRAKRTKLLFSWLLKFPIMGNIMLVDDDYYSYYSFVVSSNQPVQSRHLFSVSLLFRPIKVKQS